MFKEAPSWMVGLESKGVLACMLLTNKACGCLSDNGSWANAELGRTSSCLEFTPSRLHA